MEKLKDNPGKRLLGEPVTRPDGLVLALWVYSDNLLVVEAGYIGAWYLSEEVRLLGHGSFQEGALRIGQRFYTAEEEELRPGHSRILDKEIRLIKEGFS